MDSENIKKYTDKYLDTIAHASDFIYVDEDDRIPLTNVYVMLEEVEVKKKSQKKKSQKPRGPEIKKPPIPLSKVLSENNHVVLQGEPGVGKSTTLNFIGLCFAKDKERWAKAKLNIPKSHIPVKLQLQVYGNDLVNEGAQMIPTLAREIASRLQTIQQDDAEELVTSWLETDCLLVLLDGLDEIHEERGRVINKVVWELAWWPPDVGV